MQFSMAQLPPKAPNMTQNWSSFPLQMMTIPSNSIPMAAAAAATQQPSWVDEFIVFSSARRNAHRRSISDSIAFLPLLEECPTYSPPRTTMPGNDEQLMSMFADEMSMRAAPPPVTSSNPSTPLDQNSNDEEKLMPTPPAQDHQPQQPKEEPREADSSCKPDPSPTEPSNTAASGDTIVDPRRVKRILANRKSAQRSRVRKLQYISELERCVTTLQTELSALSPRVAFLDHQRMILNVDNSALKQRIAALVQDTIFKDAHQEALKKEIERLRHVYREQNLKMATAATTAAPPPPTSGRIGGCTEKDQLILTGDR